MTQTETLPEIKMHSPEMEDFDRLNHARELFVHDSTKQISSLGQTASIDQSIRANYLDKLTTHVMGELPDAIREAEDEQQLDLFRKDELTGDNLAHQYTTSLANSLADEASKRMLLYNNYLYQLTEETKWDSIDGRHKEFNRKSLIHNSQGLQGSLDGILMMHDGDTYSAEELKALARMFTNEKFTGQDLQEYCWLSQIKSEHKLHRAIRTIRSFEDINHEQDARDAMANKPRLARLGQRVMGVVGKTRRRLGESALADFR